MTSGGPSSYVERMPDPASAGARDQWLFEWGSPADVLEFTRAQIFDEVLRLRDDERQRIGQELHDCAGQLLLSLQLSVGRLRQLNGNGNESLVGEIQDTARLIGEEIRCLAFLNHPVELNRGGLASALRSLIDGFGKRTGYQVSFTQVGDEPPENGAASLALLRVAQEALVNIHRHARASSVDARLTCRGGRLTLTISDDGVGIPLGDEAVRRGGVGLQGMRFRVEQLGGRFRVTRLKPGTRISASVPLTPSAKRQG